MVVHGKVTFMQPTKTKSDVFSTNSHAVLYISRFPGITDPIAEKGK